MRLYDNNHWAKKFDTVKHIYANGGRSGTLCRSVAACLGNNYSKNEMEVCPKCKEIQSSNKPIIA